MNKIATKQNEDQNLEILSAQRNLYSSAKRIKTIQVVLSVFISAIISILKIIYDKNQHEILLGLKWEDLSPYLSLLSVLITFGNLYLFKELISIRVKLAASMQYVFDSVVLSVPQNTFYHQIIPPELIRKYSKSITKNNKKLNKLKNWYSPNISSVEQSIGTFICLRSNFSWDIKLRTLYRFCLVIFLAIVIIVMLLPAFIYGTSLRDFVLEIVIPLMPIITFSISEIYDHHKSLVKKEQARNKIDEIWNKILEKRISQPDLDVVSRECHDLLLQLRRENPLILDWVYKLSKKRSEDEMSYTTDRMISDYKKSLEK